MRIIIVGAGLVGSTLADRLSRDGHDVAIIDNGGRRSGVDRRQIQIPFEGVDRRSNKDRRSGRDRRKSWDFPEDVSEERRSSFRMDFYGLVDKGGRRSGIDRRQSSAPIQFADRRSGNDRRAGVDRRIAPLYFLGSKERRKYLQAASS